MEMETSDKVGITALGALIIMAVLGVGWILHDDISRLKSVEASLHSAQQPKECHYLIHGDTLFVGNNDWILIKQPCVMGLR